MYTQTGVFLGNWGISLLILWPRRRIHFHTDIQMFYMCGDEGAHSNIRSWCCFLLVGFRLSCLISPTVWLLKRMTNACGNKQTADMHCRMFISKTIQWDLFLKKKQNQPKPAAIKVKQPSNNNNKKNNLSNFILGQNLSCLLPWAPVQLWNMGHITTAQFCAPKR